MIILTCHLPSPARARFVFRKERRSDQAGEEGQNWITRVLCDAGSILRRVQVKGIRIVLRRKRFGINSIRNREFLFRKENKLLNNCCWGVYCRRI